MKKNILLLVLVALLCNGAFAQVKWNTIEESAKSDNSRNGKLFFVDFYTSWCGWCKKMDKDTFSDKTVAKIMNTYYTPTKFDAEGDAAFSWNGVAYKGAEKAANGRASAHPFAKAILGQKMGFPSFAIFSADKTLITVVPGYSSAEDFTVILWYFASGDYKKYSFENYSKIFDKEIRPTMKKELGIK